MDKLLLIDDEADVRYSFERIFGQEAGLELHTVGSGEEALELIPQLRPDLVIMDIRMGGLTGIETLQRLREFDSKTPVILMTAFGTTQTAIAAMKHGAYDYVLKPFDVPKLKELVAFYRDYQKTAVPDLALSHTTDDPAANPKRRDDGTWGPFKGSKLCKWV